MSDANTLSTPARASSGPETEPFYEVGYAKPPESTRFKKGHSGNPRPRCRPKSGPEIAASVMGRPVTITEKGRRRRATMQDAVMMAQVKKALAGDYKAAKLLIELNAQAPVPEPELTKAEYDEAILEGLQAISIDEYEIITRWHTHLHALHAQVKARNGTER